jgi:peroxiredoxin
MNSRLVAILVLAGLVIAGLAVNLALVPRNAVEMPVVPEPAMPATGEPVAAANDDPVDFSLPDLDGNVRRLSEWDDKARLVNFWATWCAPCRREIPLLKSTQEGHAADNLQVIGIAVDFAEPVQLYAEEAEFNYPILVGQDEAMAAAEDAGVPFIGLPFTMIVAPGGRLLKTHVGEIMESHVERIVAVLGQLEAGELDLPGARDALDTL